ncbi:polysaccharide biosynthesis protein [Candidatus Pelagibacter sp. HIMB1695]|uniref:polysaccharide biosynthesis protein n=1 Tax=Candidatus Pelagibacter sp. HIMB1695 TaxID=3413364 RepID=UPI003F87F234
MLFYNKKFSEEIFSLSRFSKKSVAIITDVFFCVFTIWLAFYLRLEELVRLKDIGLTTIFLTILLTIPIFWITGIYRTLFRYAGLSIFSTISLSVFIYGLIFFSIISMYGVKDVPRSIGVIQPMLLYLFIIASRFLAKYLLTGSFNKSEKEKINVLIYGAGGAGRQLFLSLEGNAKYKVEGFLDDDRSKHRQYLLGKKIYDSKNLDTLKENKEIKLILVAIPSLNKISKKEIIQKISNKGIEIKTLPNISDIIEDKLSFSDVKDYLIDDLLEREPVEANQHLLSQNIASKTILVTGAGGTIGVELSRQILKLKPKKLILFELNEFALFNIHEELSYIYKNLEIVPLLGNILDQKKLEKVFKNFKVDTVYHTAAYKHVPLVEINICEGVRNNILGTLSVVKAATNQQIKNLVLISSDKAVRPTNIMGASKRFSELCLQVYKEKNLYTNFSIVRFGNVLASSGSVIPKFKQQIIEGGPVTLTHNDVTRYFMTVPEAAQLVIQAGALGKNAEVFVLDMGKSIKIRDMIIKMINLSGQTLKDENNLNGDIEIKVTGLRPGEKLFEELLIGDNPQQTIHPKIKKIQEPSMSFDQFEKNINELTIQLDNQNSKEVKKILDRVIRFYNSNSELVDYIYNEEKDLNETLPNKDDKSNVIKLN